MTVAVISVFSVGAAPFNGLLIGCQEGRVGTLAAERTQKAPAYHRGFINHVSHVTSLGAGIPPRYRVDRCLQRILFLF